MSDDVPTFEVRGGLLDADERIDLLETQVYVLAFRIAKFERIFAELGRDCDPDASAAYILHTV